LKINELRQGRIPTTQAANPQHLAEMTSLLSGQPLRIPKSLRDPSGCLSSSAGRLLPGLVTIMVVGMDGYTWRTLEAPAFPGIIRAPLRGCAGPFLVPVRLVERTKICSTGVRSSLGMAITQDRELVSPEGETRIGLSGKPRTLDPIRGVLSASIRPPAARSEAISCVERQAASNMMLLA
jgi:hypothetical protein